MPQRVSVVIPTRDRPNLLREALASVRAIEGPDLELEIILIDNGTDPETGRIGAEFDALYVRMESRGASAARNEGLARATGGFVTFLDDDDVWLAGHIRPHLALLAARPDLDAVVGQVQLADHALTPINDAYPESLPDDGDVFRQFLRQTPQIGATVIRAGVRETVGTFDEALESSEDWDWHLRLSLRHGVGFVKVPCILFRQRLMATHDDLQWLRMRYTWPVLTRNIRAAGPRRPPRSFILRTYLAFRGHYFWYFTQSSLRHGQAGDKSAMRTAFYRALRASPLHAARDLVRSSTFRKLIPAVLGLRSRPPS